MGNNENPKKSHSPTVTAKPVGKTSGTEKRQNSAQIPKGRKLG